MARSSETMLAKLAEHVQGPRWPIEFTHEKQKQVFQSILLTYDLMDDMTKSVEDIQDVREQKIMRQLVAKYILQVRCATDILIALYTDVVFDGRPINSDVQKAIGLALRSPFEAFREYLQQADLRIQKIPQNIDPKRSRISEVAIFRPKRKRKSIPPEAR